MVRSQLQEQADKCRVAQVNLDDATLAYNNQLKIVDELESQIMELTLRLQEEQARFREVGVIKRFAAEAVEVTVSEMRRICNKVSEGNDVYAYGAKTSLAKTEGR